MRRRFALASTAALASLRARAHYRYRHLRRCFSVQDVLNLSKTSSSESPHFPSKPLTRSSPPPAQPAPKWTKPEAAKHPEKAASLEDNITSGEVESLDSVRNRRLPPFLVEIFVERFLKDSEKALSVDELRKDFDKSRMLLHKTTPLTSQHKPAEFQNWTNEDEVMSMVDRMFRSLVSAGVKQLAPNDDVSDAALRRAARRVVERDDIELFKRMSEHFEKMYAAYLHERGHARTGVSRNLFREQLQLETMARERAIDGYRQRRVELEKCGRLVSMKAAQRVLLTWYDAFVSAIAAKQDEITAQTRNRSPEAPFLCMLSAPALGVIALHEIVAATLSRKEGTRTTQLARTIGRAIEAEVALTLVRKRSKKKLRHIHQSRTLAALKHDPTRPEQWSGEILVKLGSLLMELLLESAKMPPNAVALAVSGRYKRISGQEDLNINEDTPAFFHEMQVERDERTRFDKRLCRLVMHPLVLETIDQRHMMTEVQNPVHMPMVLPPRPWTLPDVGGYLSLSSQITRGSSEQCHREAIELADLTTLYASLDALSSVPWRINQKVLGTFERVWMAGGGFADLPDRTDLEVPDIDPIRQRRKENPKYEFTADDKKQFVKFFRAVKENNERHSLRFDTEYKLEVARRFRDHVIYFPHNLDFRGRAYPIPPHLQYMGSDACRGLLLFADKKPLGEKGLFWLKVHVANVFGNDKATFAERAKFVDANIDAVKRSALDPLGDSGGERWWASAEDPWQCLAACIELTAALELDDPRRFESSLPIHMDGSCNGLQHYAALGLDLLGGSSVNLTPSERPQDVYMGVCKRVLEKIAIDAKNGDRLAKALDGCVDRKMVKQTVMTSVYGVTFVGAREQILKRLEERDDIEFEEEEGVTRDRHIFNSSFYITRLTLTSLGDMFSSAQKIMLWLGDAALQMARCGHSVSWITPLGLPVFQPYKRESSFQVTTNMQKFSIVDNLDNLPVSGSKQRSAFPPNFVHSLDSSHMMMTSLACRDAGITFAAVHDSFWTHAGSVGEMNIILRKQFVNLHKKPILDDLARSFRQRYPECDFAPLPERGQLDITQVLDSDYFFA